MQAFIALENMGHTYTDNEGNRVDALKSINLTIAKGEFVAVIGTNGSGKSTLSRHVNALLQPSEGCCFVNGMDTRQPEQLWQIRQTVGMVFQNPDNQLVATLVEEDVAFGPENLGLPPVEIVRRVEEALAQVGMTEYRQHGPHLLSGGQKQRIAIAGVLAMRPSCLVLDEPTAMLDPQGRSEVLATVHKLHREEGMTVLYITHFMEEAVTADRIIVMHQGSIQLDGSPAEVFSQVAVLKKIGLDVPVAAEVAQRLREKGWKLPGEIITNEALAVALCP
ncbi:energy-coupling factor transporter ATPase [Propionispora hippei]|nr:energy-coupling factor transporter ATPase [Propionispora hippei]